jgi:hypothetical protein
MAVFRVDKTRDYTVMSNHHLRNTELSLKAKGLHSLMLSLPENWDYTTKGLARICKDGVDAICSTLNELEQHGYLTRRRLRDDKGRLGDIEYTIHEQPAKPEDTPLPPKRENPVLDKPVLDLPKREKPVLDKPVLGKPEQAKPKQENPAQLNTISNQALNELSTELLNIHQSIIPGCMTEQQAELAVKPEKTPGTLKPVNPDLIDRIDEISESDTYREIIKGNIEYDFLCERYGKKNLDEIVELALEVVCSKRKYVRMAGNDIPKEIAKSRMLKLDSSHIEYVLDCLHKNTTKVRNIKAYVLTALYNAPATIDKYYQAEVNHDLYGVD